MSGARRQVFAYPDSREIAILVFVLLFAAPFAAASLWQVAIAPDLSSVVTLFFSSCLVWMLVSAGLRHRPIALSDERIEALLSGRAWRAIDWRDVDRIGKRVVPANFDVEGGWMPACELLFFRSGRRTIVVKSTISDYAGLKQWVNDKARRRGIELVAVEPQPLWRPTVVTRLDAL